MLCLFVSLSLCGYVCVMRFRCQCLCWWCQILHNLQP
jgi:hypothetical protein